VAKPPPLIVPNDRRGGSALSAHPVKLEAESELLYPDGHRSPIHSPRCE
jgi:hypothetical protein